MTVGREGVKQFVRDAFKNTPAIRVTAEDMIAEGDRVACRVAVTGTDASTGKPMRLLIMEMYRFAHGTIAEDPLAHVSTQALYAILRQINAELDYRTDR